VATNWVDRLYVHTRTQLSRVSEQYASDPACCPRLV